MLIIIENYLKELSGFALFCSTKLGRDRLFGAIDTEAYGERGPFPIDFPIPPESLYHTGSGPSRRVIP